MTAVRVIHLLAMAFFVGGQLVLVAALVPVLRGRDELRVIARRFAAGSLVALAVLALTGAVMASEYAKWDAGLLHVKLTLVAVTAGLVVWHTRRPGAHALEALVLVGSLAVVWLGVELAH